MMPHAKALEEQLSLITDQLAQHDFVFTKPDFLCNIVQQPSRTFEMLLMSV